MSRLANRRILVVEDEFLIAAALCDMLEDAAAVVVGPVSTVTDAIQLLQAQPVDAAILDMNLNGQWSDPVAEDLRARRIPFVFTTGYGANERTERFGVRVVPKPYGWEEVEEQLAQAMLATEDRALLDEAIGFLKRASAADPNHATAHHLLGTAFARKGDYPHAELAAAQAHFAEGNIKEAHRFAKRAVTKLTPGSPDWLRADDIIKYKQPKE